MRTGEFEIQGERRMKRSFFVQGKLILFEFQKCLEDKTELIGNLYRYTLTLKYTLMFVLTSLRGNTVDIFIFTSFFQQPAKGRELPQVLLASGKIFFEESGFKHSSNK